MAGDVRHGTRYGYTRQRCRCEECTEANARYQREWARARRRPDGDPCRTVPVRRAARQLALLESQGWSRREVARQASVSRSTLNSVADGSVRHVQVRVAEALEGLGPCPPRRVPSGAARGALEAMRRAGYSTTEVAQGCGLGGGSGRVRVRRATVELDTHRRILALLARLGGEVTADGTVRTDPLPAQAARELGRLGRATAVRA